MEVKNLLTNTQEKLTTKEQDFAEITLVNQSLLEKITTLESELTSKEVLITNLEKVKQEITQHLSELQEKVDDKTVSLEEAQEEINQLSCQVLYQQQLSSKVSKEKTELNNSLNFLEEQLL